MADKLNISPLSPVQGVGGSQGPPKTNGTQGAKGEFDRLMTELNSQAATAPKDGLVSSQLKFSQHAIDRMSSRGITFQPNEMKSIEDAVKKAAEKGSKDTLVISGDKALIVSAKNNTVVTVMDKNQMKENVFTNIDSTVLI